GRAAQRGFLFRLPALKGWSLETVSDVAEVLLAVFDEGPLIRGKRGACISGVPRLDLIFVCLLEVLARSFLDPGAAVLPGPFACAFDVPIEIIRQADRSLLRHAL